MTAIWFKEIDLISINKFNESTLVSHLGITITEITKESLSGTMPVDVRTLQPAGLLHGGASCVLAETLGSIAANLTIDLQQKLAVGQHIEATHLRSASQGFVHGIARPIYMGQTTQTWKIDIFNDEKKLICDSKIIMAIINRR